MSQIERIITNIDEKFDHDYDNKLVALPKSESARKAMVASHLDSHTILMMGIDDPTTQSHGEVLAQGIEAYWGATPTINVTEITDISTRRARETFNSTPARIEGPVSPLETPTHSVGSVAVSQEILV